MKTFIIKTIKLYQSLPLHTHSMCRFYPTCSNYMIGCIENFGVLKGLKLGIKRILRCHPFGKKGIDSVPIKEN